MYVIIYFQKYSFHPPFLEKIVIFRRFQQKTNEVYDLSKTTFYQLKDAADAVLGREKAASLDEMFSVELKFIVDTLPECFSKILKPKF